MFLLLRKKQQKSNNKNKDIEMSKDKIIKKLKDCKKLTKFCKNKLKIRETLFKKEIKPQILIREKFIN